jgi:hypothetical protein
MRQTALSCAVVAALMAGAPTAADAEIGDFVTCQFADVTGNFTLVVPDPLSDLADGSLDDLEVVRYHFGGPATCLGSWGGAPMISSAVLTSGGTFSGLTAGAGTMRAEEGESRLDFANPVAPDAGNFAYTIYLLSLNGDMVIGPPVNDGAWVGDGAVKFTFSAPLGPWSAFTIDGAFVMADES